MATVVRLNEYPVKLRDLKVGEYMYEIPVLFIVHSGNKKKKKKKRNLSEEEQIIKDFRQVTTALLNTSGGIIRLVTPSGRPFTDEEYDDWAHRQKEAFLSFIPKHTVAKCISVERRGTDVYVVVRKSDVFITANTYMHKRQLAENCQVNYYNEVYDILDLENEENMKPEQTTFTPSVDARCRMVEAEHMEFAQYQGNTAGDIMFKLKDRKLDCMLAMANQIGGGDFVIGIKRCEESKAYRYVGQQLDGEEQSNFKEQLRKLLTEDEDGTRRVWGIPGVTPEEGIRWTCTFTPFTDDNSLVLITVHVNFCPGGVFEQSPEAFIIRDDGKIEELSFEEWKGRHQAKKKKVPTATLR